MSIVNTKIPPLEVVIVVVVMVRIPEEAKSHGDYRQGVIVVY